jgi:hypothetical protein
LTDPDTTSKKYRSQDGCEEDDCEISHIHSNPLIDIHTNGALVAVHILAKEGFKGNVHLAWSNTRCLARGDPLGLVLY